MAERSEHKCLVPLSRPQHYRVCQLAELILTFAAGKTFIMRAPLRVAYALRFDAVGRVNGHRDGSSSQGRRSSAHLKDDLRLLERDDIVRRRPGYIQILNFAALVRLAEGVR